MHRILLLAAALGSAACGNNTPPQTPTPTAAETPAVVTPAPVASAAPTGDQHDIAEAAPHVDPNESSTHIVLQPLFDKKAKPAYPKATVGDLDCLQRLPLTGKHQDDYKVITDRCGAPTGMVEYTKPAEGRLHAKHDVRDDFKLSVQKGMCYRYFAVADQGIKDIDMVILRKGALIGTDKADQQVAVIEAEKLWCVTDDEELEFQVAVDGRGAGGYSFGVWARPSK